MSSAAEGAKQRQPDDAGPQIAFTTGMAHKITDVMTPIPQCCTPDDSIIEVARVMEQNDVGIVPIIESQDTRRVLGVLTDRDIVLRIVAQGRDPNEIVSVRDFMTNEIVSVRPDADILHAEEKHEGAPDAPRPRRRRKRLPGGHRDRGGSWRASPKRPQLGDTEKAITHR